MLLVPRYCMNFVIRRTRLEDVYEGEAFVVYAVNDEFLQVLDLISITARHVGRAHCKSKRRRIHAFFYCPAQRRRSLETFHACGRVLPFCQPVDCVVLDKICYIQVPPHAVNEMVATYAVAVAVAADDYNFQSFIRQLYSCCNGHRPAMQTFEAVGVDEMGGFTTAIVSHESPNKIGVRIFFHFKIVNQSFVRALCYGFYRNKKSIFGFLDLTENFFALICYAYLVPGRLYDSAFQDMRFHLFHIERGEYSLSGE